ncbi:MAG: hypothetical protein MJE63_06325 [Proteobacteria bacterium]|nr:hypothetical protein [Pseudomonadota bacterium]
MEKLLVAVMGHRDSGKSYTWNQLFGGTVKTGKYIRKLYLNDSEYVDVFLVSGSPEERGEYVGDLITVDNPRIVLCSMQYRKDVTESLDYFINNDYFIFLHWINPGYSDSPVIHHDINGVVPYINSLSAMFGIRDGKKDAASRVNEIKEYIYGWAKYRNLIKTV